MANTAVTALTAHRRTISEAESEQGMDNQTTNEVKIAGIDLHTLLSDGLRVLRRTAALFAALTLLLTGALCLRVFRSYQPMYRASATFTVYVANALQSEIRSYNTATAEQMAKTFPYILTSGALNERVMSSLDIPAMPAVSASVLSNTNIFTLTVTSADPELAYDVLEAVIECYPDVAEFVVGPTVMNLLDESGVPQEPFNHRDYRAAIKRGVLTGAFLWVAAALVLASLRSTVHSEEELREVLSLRTLGVLPAVRGRGRGRAVCPRFDGGAEYSGFSESVRLLRMRTEKEMRERGMKVLLVSSATPGEGKTTVAINLAMALAAQGKHVLLADCDLRNPSVAGGFGMENGKGLTEYLKGETPYQEILRQSEQENLYLVLAGQPTANASELLAAPACREFVEACRKVFDVVILDTPPAALLADASELAVLADGALMTVRQNYASRSQIMEGAQILSDSHLPLLGCVLNYASSRSPYGGYYGYGYGGYGRAYGEKKEKAE